MYATVGHIAVESGSTAEFASRLQRDVVPRLHEVGLLHGETINAGGGTVMLVATYESWRAVEASREVLGSWLAEHGEDFDPRVQHAWAGEVLVETIRS